MTVQLGRAYPILWAIADNEGVLEVGADASGAVRRLADQGLVTVEPRDPHGRLRVKITERGRTAMIGRARPNRKEPHAICPNQRRRA